ncbi:nucleolar protein dao-5-like isoform X2 [Anabas testudineus]|uniref:nucleolar protein dao-5-like isoform X2 n=1 Tax=Anabas testudineus TaxID=64144 RepID=UPI000E45C14E|nr:nucleolar protein dao-5-like isoform X2 [Anabas testudineus]
MDCNTADLPASVAHDSPGRDSVSSDDLVPLSTLLMKPHSETKKSCENTRSCTAHTKTGRNASDDSADDEPLMRMKTALAAKSPEIKENKSSRSNGTNRNADLNTDESSDNEPLIKIAKVSSKAAEKPFSMPKKSADKKKQVFDDSSDDDPLVKMKTTYSLTKKTQKKENKSFRSNGKNNRTADLNTDESSDNEPLIKIAKVSSKAAKKPFSVPPKRSVKADGDTSDDEPLSEIAKKLQSQHGEKESVVSSKKENLVIKSKRNAARKIVKYAESSSDSSDDEPLSTKKKITTKADNKKKTKCTGKSLRDSSSGNSSDDDVLLVNLIAKKKKTLKKNTKMATVSRGSASKNRKGVSDESSDDKPLINLVKKNQTGKQMKTKRKASAPKKRDITLKKPQKMPGSGLSSNSSDDETLIKAGKHPQVTKILRIILERCDGEDSGATGSLNKTKREKTTAEEPMADESESSE